MSRIDRIVEYTEGPDVLDLGCVQHDLDNVDNSDWLHGRLCDEFETVVGVDILPEIAELAAEGYTVRQANVETMDLDRQFDTVVAGELIEHIANPGLMLDTIQSHLKPDGQAVLSTPNPWGIPLLNRILHRELSVNDEHTAWYGPKTIAQLCKRYGLDLEMAETTRRDHGGVTRVAQWFDHDWFAGTTWIFVLKHERA